MWVLIRHCWWRLMLISAHSAPHHHHRMIWHRVSQSHKRNQRGHQRYRERARQTDTCHLHFSACLEQRFLLLATCSCSDCKLTLLGPAIFSRNLLALGHGRSNHSGPMIALRIPKTLPINVCVCVCMCTLCMRRTGRKRKWQTRHICRYIGIYFMQYRSSRRCIWLWL